MRKSYVGIAVILFVVSMFCLYQGYDRMVNYRNSDYKSVNAYVGGDAYNYIINGTYSTSFFVLGAMFAFIGTASLIAGKIDELINVFKTSSPHEMITENEMEHHPEDLSV